MIARLRNNQSQYSWRGKDMAGIGFALKRLADKRTLGSSAAALTISMVVSVGPWVMTVLAVATLYALAAPRVGLDVLYEFRTALIYNFALTLVATGPVVMVTTRLLADRIYAKDVSAAPGVLIAAIGLVLLFLTPLAAALYIGYADLSWPMRIASIVNFNLVALLWIATVFLTALKDYLTVTFAFALGLAVSAGSGLLLSTWGPAGLMCGFSLGLALALFLILARTFAEYPAPLSGWRELFVYLRRYPTLAASGLVYNAAIWADKWVMWSAPEAVWPSSGLVSYPAYDGAMFFAQLTLIPAFAVFVLSVETNFFDTYRRFYRTIDAHGSLERIKQAHQDMLQTLSHIAWRIIVLQTCIALFAILLTPGLAHLTGLHGQQFGIFRFGVLGSLFHALFLFASIGLAYFDLRRQVLQAQVLFLVLNAGATMVTLYLGFAWYGYGYFAATTLAFAYVSVLLTTEVRRLPYLTFILNNPALKMTRPAS